MGGVYLIVFCVVFLRCIFNFVSFIYIYLMLTFSIQPMNDMFLNMSAPKVAAGFSCLVHLIRYCVRTLLIHPFLFPFPTCRPYAVHALFMTSVVISLSSNSPSSALFASLVCPNWSWLGRHLEVAVRPTGCLSRS